MIRSGLGASVGVGVGVGVGVAVAVGVAVGELDGLGVWLFLGLVVGGGDEGVGTTADSLGAGASVAAPALASAVDGAATVLGDAPVAGDDELGALTAAQAAHTMTTMPMSIPRGSCNRRGPTDMRLIRMTSGLERLLVWVAAGPRRHGTVARAR